MFSNPHRRFGAFTLIELLIVVAIISILTAIAIPNFMEAQTRAKVAKALADMNTLATGIESYAVDHSVYPPSRPPGPDQQNFVPLSRRLVPITTPIAYITTIPQDAFPAIAGSYGLETRHLDTYDYYDWESDKREGEDRQNSTRGHMWRLASSGPDLYQAFGIERETLISEFPDPRDFGGVEYDPSNGTMSWGDIIRLGPKYGDPDKPIYEDDDDTGGGVVGAGR